MNKLKKLQKDNRGLSLLELLVVFSVMTVIMSIASFSLSLTPGTQAKELLYSLDSMFSRTKTGSITKAGNVYMKVVNKDGKYAIEYYEDGIKKEHSTLGSDGQVFLYYQMNDGGDYELVDTGEVLYFSFDRRTTGFQTLITASQKDSSFTAPSNWKNSTEEFSCTGLKVTVGKYPGNTMVEYHIDLGIVTGTHYKDLK